MKEKIRQIELGFRDIGFIVIPAEFINKLIIRDIRMEFIQSSDANFQREAIADYVYVEINDENLEFSLYENDWRFSEYETDLLNILSDYDVTHIAIKYVDNSKEEFMVAWSDLEKDFLSSTFVRVDEANSMICIVIDLDKCQFDKHLERQESEENDL